MFTNERHTPRPRPPAQMRRSSKGGLLSSDSAPPPPYAFDFQSLQESMEGDVSDPIAAAARMIGIELDSALDMPPVAEDVSNKSKAELTDLFLQAEKIIKAREQELNVAANLGKTLLETNEALKLRHDALLLRLPAMQSPSTSISSKPAARTSDDNVSSPSSTLTRVHSCANSVSSSTPGSPVHSRSNSIIASSPGRGRVRRISASPSALHALSETNAELIAELTRLYNATDTAQTEGAQRLRKLEREIGGLKSELEATQRTNAELEEKVKGKLDEERRREREERLRRLRAGGDGHDSDSAGENAIPDFAPQGSGGEKWDSIPVTPHIQCAASSHPAESDAEQSDGEAQSTSALSMASSNPASQNISTRPGEYAVVAQLYHKVIELQEANAELSARNRATNKQLARAEREALSIKNLYDAIGEELAADQSEQSDPSTGTIRVGSRGAGSTAGRSNSRSLRMRGDPFLSDNKQVKKGSYRSLGSKVLYRGVRANRNRPPLTDSLFSPPVSISPKRRNKTPPSVVLFPSSPCSKPRLQPKLKGKAEPQRDPTPFLSPVGSLVPRRNFSADSGSSASSRASVASSFLGTSCVRYGGRNRGRRSLGSELGSEFGDDWGGTPSRHSSLFGDGSVRALSDVETEAGAYADAEDEDPALAALRDALTPPLAGRLLEQDEHILPVGSLQSSPGGAFHLVAHAVTARPTRWLDSDNWRVREAGARTALMYAPAGEDPWETTRYPEIEPGAETDEEHSTLRMHRRQRALGRMASTAHSRRASGALFPSASQLQTMDCSPRRGLVDTLKRTSADMLIELWIFLQFVVVICMFLFTMSRRGPREVLGAPPRRA